MTSTRLGGEGKEPNAPTVYLRRGDGKRYQDEGDGISKDLHPNIL
jgi:hypothetical protein